MKKHGFPRHELVVALSDGRRVIGRVGDLMSKRPTISIPTGDRSNLVITRDWWEVIHALNTHRPLHVEV